MNPKMLIGIVLIVVGILGLGYGTISWTTRERVVDAGPIKIDADKEHSIPIAPVVGAVALAGGIAMLVMGRKSGA